ncbi:hypothetical protein IWX50DRAFT_619802 [Phyllosticta citricarpa]
MHLSVEQGINVAPAAYFLSLRMLTSRCIIHVERRSTPASIECVLLASVHALLCTRSRPPANKSVDLFFGWTRRVGVRHTFPKSYSGRSTGVAAAAAAAPSSFVPALHHELGGQTGRQTEKGSVVRPPHPEGGEEEDNRKREREQVGWSHAWPPGSPRRAAADLDCGRVLTICLLRCSLPRVCLSVCLAPSRNSVRPLSLVVVIVFSLLHSFGELAKS